MVGRKRAFLGVNEPLASFSSISSMQNGQHFSQLLLIPLTKFGVKVQMIF
jgi:hypothetical protein